MMNKNPDVNRITERGSLHSFRNLASKKVKFFLGMLVIICAVSIWSAKAYLIDDKKTDNEVQNQAIESAVRAVLGDMNQVDLQNARELSCGYLKEELQSTGIDIESLIKQKNNEQGAVEIKEIFDTSTTQIDFATSKVRIARSNVAEERTLEVRLQNDRGSWKVCSFSDSP
ncbi:MAG: hypothetical protein ACRCSF_00150 [Mycobacteriaceae bacterium]